MKHLQEAYAELLRPELWNWPDDDDEAYPLFQAPSSLPKSARKARR